MVVMTIIVYLLFIEPTGIPLEEAVFLYRSHWFWKRYARSGVGFQVLLLLAAHASHPLHSCSRCCCCSCQPACWVAALVLALCALQRRRCAPLLCSCCSFSHCLKLDDGLQCTSECCSRAVCHTAQEKLVIERRMREAAERGEVFRCPNGAPLLQCCSDRQCHAAQIKLAGTVRCCSCRPQRSGSSSSSSSSSSSNSSRHKQL